MRHLGFLVCIVAVLFAAGCGESASEPDKKALDRAKEQGESSGERVGFQKGRESAIEQVPAARRHGYAEGLRRGRNIGTLLTTPENLRSDTNYIVGYRRGSGGWELNGWLEMPLFTTWRCEDLEGCVRITEGPGAPYEPYESGEEPYESGEEPYEPYEEPYVPGPPTTENFNEGNGYVVECADGTFSHSGGIQGACSHHGGER